MNYGRDLFYYNPYGTDEHGGTILYDSGEKSLHTTYADRLRQEDYKKYHELSLKHFNWAGDSWSGRHPEAIEAFLNDFFAHFLPKGVSFCRMVEYKGTNGYSTYRLDYNEKS